MRVITETLTAEGEGQPILIGPRGHCLIIASAFTGTSFDLTAQLHVLDQWIAFAAAAAKDVGENVNLGRYANNLPEQTSVRVSLTGVGITSMTYTAIVDDLPDDRII